MPNATSQPLQLSAAMCMASARVGCARASYGEMPYLHCLQIPNGDAAVEEDSDAYFAIA